MSHPSGHFAGTHGRLPGPNLSPGAEPVLLAFGQAPMAAPVAAVLRGTRLAGAWQGAGCGPGAVGLVLGCGGCRAAAPGRRTGHRWDPDPHQGTEPSPKRSAGGVAKGCPHPSFPPANGDAGGGRAWVTPLGSAPQGPAPGRISFASALWKDAGACPWSRGPRTAVTSPERLQGSRGMRDSSVLGAGGGPGGWILRCVPTLSSSAARAGCHRRATTAVPKPQRHIGCEMLTPLGWDIRALGRATCQPPTMDPHHVPGPPARGATPGRDAHPKLSPAPRAPRLGPVLSPADPGPCGEDGQSRDRRFAGSCGSEQAKLELLINSRGGDR